MELAVGEVTRNSILQFSLALFLLSTHRRPGNPLRFVAALGAGRAAARLFDISGLQDLDCSG